MDTILLKREIASVEFKDLKLRELLPGDEAKALQPDRARDFVAESLKLMYAVQNSQFAGEFTLRRNFAAQFLRPPVSPIHHHFAVG